MSNEIARTLIYTTATYIYDLDDTECVNPKAGQTTSGRNVRLVSVHPDDVARQYAAYVSNLESALSEHDWKCEQQFGNVVAFESEAVA